MVILVILQLGFTIEVIQQMIMTVDFQQEAVTHQALEKGMMRVMLPVITVATYQLRVLKGLDLVTYLLQLTLTLTMHPTLTELVLILTT